MASSTAIPLHWKTTETPQGNAEQKPQETGQNGSDKVEGKSRKRGNQSQARNAQKKSQSNNAKRAKVQRRQEADNSCSDDDEPKVLVEDIEEDDEDVYVENSRQLTQDNTLNITQPGTPMAQSTPMVPGRSAFSMLQPSLAMHPHPMPQPPHYGASAGYFFPPPEPMFHPAYSFMHWPRTAAPMGYPAWGMPPLAQPKTEPQDTAANQEKLLTKLEGMGNAVGGQQAQKRKMKKPVKKNTEVKEQQDSGLGDMDDSEMTTNKHHQTDNSNVDGTLNGTFVNATAAIPLGMAPIPLPLHPINGYETYCTVPGRLTLLSNLKKYRVSIAEIQRRLAPPECLNASILGGILRKAKNKDGGRLLREQLLTYGVELTSGRRKQGPLTCFSSLVEEEAAQIAHDFNLVNQKHYPSKEAASYAMNHVQSAHEASLYRMELFYASKFLNRIMDFHKADRSPVADMPLKQEEDIVNHLAIEQQRGLTNYSLLTHGFGGRAVQSVVESVLSVVSECSTVLNVNYPQPGTSSSSIPMGF